MSGGGNVLLAGATGSGKTEVYIRACEAALAAGHGAIVLVPEIALTPQTLGRFRARFGDRVALLHSGLSEAERRDERERIVVGEAPVVVGARSAVFAPLPSLGVICVDEEHDASYKQESDPRYDARTVAAKRAALEGAVAIFGSATPRPESWHTLERLELGGRIAAPLPTVRVVDLRHETGYPLSAPLLAELGRLAETGGKAILLLNRRGVAPALHCRACGTTRRCLELRRRAHAAWRRNPSLPPLRRPRARGRDVPRLWLAGARADRSRDATARARARAPRPRARADPARCRRGRQAGRAARGARAVRARRAGRPRRDADGREGPPLRRRRARRGRRRRHGPRLPDFRAEERTFQLLTQLAGRSGRDAPGRVLIQTFQPESRAVEHASRHDVAGFLAGELERRRALGYPPFRHLVRVLVSGPELADATRALEELKAGLPEFELLGPAPLLRLRGRYRAQLVGKTDRPRALASRAAALLAAATPAMRRAGLAAVVDVDPQSV